MTSSSAFINYEVFNAFAFDKINSGNPCAVFVLNNDLSTEKMQFIAEQMNLSETVFIHRHYQPLSLRYFTPRTEVRFCAHAMLSSAKSEAIKSSDSYFSTPVGKVPFQIEKDKVHIDLPLSNIQKNIAKPLLEKIENLFPSDFPLNAIALAGDDLLIEVKTEEAVRQFEPSLTKLKTMKQFRGLILCSLSSHLNYDIVCRCFYPSLGVDEDPATGSAHAALAPYFSERLKSRFLRSMQLSKRQAYLEMELYLQRLRLSGTVQKSQEGKYLL